MSALCEEPAHHLVAIRALQALLVPQQQAACVKDVPAGGRCSWVGVQADAAELVSKLAFVGRVYNIIDDTLRMCSLFAVIALLPRSFLLSSNFPDY